MYNKYTNSAPHSPFNLPFGDHKEIHQKYIHCDEPYFLLTLTEELG